MPYDDNEKLKDQVGVLVGLLNSSNDAIVKLAKAQLIQLGKNIVPFLETVLDDMSKKGIEDQRKMDELDQNMREEENKGYRIIVSSRLNKKKEIEREAKFSPSIVMGVLDVLSFFADDTLIQFFSDWLPWKAAVEGLIKIGSESAFRAVTPTLSDLFSLYYLDSESAYDVKNLIESYIGESGYDDPVYSEGPIEKRYISIKVHIIKEIADFFDKDVIARFVNSYPSLSPGLKDLAAGLIITGEVGNYSEQILEWMDKGSDEDAERLSDIAMSLRLKINRELSIRLFSKLISDYEETESFLQYLLHNVEIEDMVDIELDLYLKSNQDNNPKGVVKSVIFTDDYVSYPEHQPISNFIISKLKERREDTISYITRVLAEKNKERVKAASWLLNQIIEASDEDAE